MMKELLIGPSEQVDTFICQESFRRVKKKKGEKNQNTRNSSGTASLLWQQFDL